MSEPIYVTGGAGGERAVTEDLDWAVGTLRRAAADVHQAARQLRNKEARYELMTSTDRPWMLDRVDNAATGVAPTLEDLLDDTADRLQRVAAAYVQAERSARHRVGLGRALGEKAADVVSIAGFMARVGVAVAVAFTPGTSKTAALRLLPREAPATTAVLDRDTAELISNSPVIVQLEVALTLALWMIEHLSGEPWKGAVIARAEPSQQSTSLEQEMRRLLAVEDMNDGSIQIDRWTDSNGVTYRVVHIPGTEDWGPTDPNPADGEADGMLNVGVLPDFAKFVWAALAADGAKPGEPVLLVGHSLGGTVAAALAANADFRRQFTARAVVTAGSPVGSIELPRSVNALHLEGTRDIVPGLDRTPSPDTPQRVTVHHDVRESELPQLEGEGLTIASAHHLDIYAQTARLVDEGLSASTDAWLDAQKGFLAPATQVTTTTYSPQ